MNNLVTIDPWSIFDDLFTSGSRAFRDVRARAAGRFPPVNVYLDDTAALIDLELPGKTAKDVELSLEPQAVVVSHKAKPSEDNANPRPVWSRRLELPFRVNAERASAKFKNGILRIALPKADADGKRLIAIQG